MMHRLYLFSALAFSISVVSLAHSQELEDDQTDDSLYAGASIDAEKCYDMKWLRREMWVAKRDAGMLTRYPPLDEYDSEWTRRYKREVARTKLESLEAKIPAVKVACQAHEEKAAAEAAEKARVAKLPSVRIGMTEKQVLTRTSWGKPDSINRTTTAQGTTEQWVYGDGQYLYFTNGKLTVIQN